MSLGSFFKGTSVDQNSKFTDKDKKIINSMTWPEIFNEKVDISKVTASSDDLGEIGKHQAVD